MSTSTSAVSNNVEVASGALKNNNFNSVFVDTKEEALQMIKDMIPAGASIMNGSSTTLHEIGYVEYVKSGEHQWKDLHAEILTEKDPKRQGDLRRQSVLSDYYLGSAHAVTETGQLVFASNSGSQLPHLAFTSKNIILVVSTNKIVPTLEDAFTRIQETIIPLEDERMKKAHGYGTSWTKTLVLNKENPALGRNVTIIFVNEKLGF